MSDLQLNLPEFRYPGYRPPSIGAGLHLDFHLDQLEAHQHWVSLPALGSPMPVPLRLGALVLALRPATSAFSQFAAQQPAAPPNVLLQKITTFLDDDLRKQIADALVDKFATNLNVAGMTNIASGEPVSIGKIRSDGTPDYDGVDKVVPGFPVPLVKGLGMLGVARKLRFSGAGEDVKLGLLFDKDAVLNGRFRNAFSGAQAELPLPPLYRGWATNTLTVTAGRDQRGGLGLGLSLGGTFW
jgi:hypothetical protein